MPTDTANALAQKSCKDCAGDAKKLNDKQIATLLGDVPEWEQFDGRIARTFHFKNYYESMAFVNATAWISHREDHHPDLEVGYNKVRVSYSTHSVGGLSESDFICAAKIESLMKI
ncbi:MAG TPA: 4a-hydroxytetrahydrobiopterin dehydratase [Tepidisphaeraceae bacterium]|jgi:4a-hydroxytetrahydrobiopterin dehydratase|nr:4a-hydroxytetrahydrobiopterin dehydratase [Tepidisphaeraceae bacterium]